MLELPNPLQTYFSALNSKDQNAFLQCFAKDAYVHDEGNGHRGHKEIAAWNSWAAKTYNCSYELLGVEKTTDGAAMTAKVTGTFPGSPITLTYKFVLENQRIQELSIK